MLNSIEKKHQNFKNSTINHDTKIKQQPLNKLGIERNFINLTKNNYKVPIESKKT